MMKRDDTPDDLKEAQDHIQDRTHQNSILVSFYDEKGISQNFSSPYTPKQNGVAERKNKTLIEAARIMLSGSVFSKQYWNEAVATACYTQNRSTVVKRHLKTPYEIFHGRIPNIYFLHVFGCPVYIHKHKDYIGKFDEKADDGYFLGYSLVSKAFRVFDTRKQQTKETYHITFDESTDAIKFLKPSVDNIYIAESERYPADEYISSLRTSQKSTSGACQLLGGKLVCWSAKKQQYVVVSSAEAEYVVAAGCCANILWMKSQLTDYDIIYEKTLEALLGLLNKVTDTLNRFASILNAHNKGVPSAGKSTASPAEGEKNTNPVTEDAELAKT
ncbi:retrovirus-related pol polyprotein from transposon TNT 1-94 [Tanacetum coccineum]